MLAFGATWADRTSLLEIHLACIRLGGTWIDKSGKTVGLGLYEHYRQAMELLWPKDDFHRWAEQELRVIAENTVSVIMGPADSGKTYIAGAKWALMEYWADPDRTLVVVSSTDMRGLELRVWGAIKSLFNIAVDRFDFLIGRPLESLHCITPDDIDEEQERARVLNRGIVCIPCLSGGRYTGLGKYHGVKAPRLRQVSDECFPSGTLVDTPQGPKPIEQILCGDYVLNPLGKSRVLGTLSKSSHQLIRIHLNNGQHIDATPNHEMLTNVGWRKCVDILPGNYLISTDETVHCLQNINKHQRFQGKILLPGLQNRVPKKAVQMVPKVFCPIGCESDLLFLFLRSKLENVSARNSGKDDFRKGFEISWEGYQQGHYKKYSRDKAPVGSYEEIRKRDSFKMHQKTWGKRRFFISGRNNIADYISERQTQLSGPNRLIFKARECSDLLSGFSISSGNAGCGSGWSISQQRETKIKRRNEGFIFERARVDRVEILKPSRDERYDEGKRGYTVHNLHIEGHHSYSVQGWCVANCQFMGESHLDALPNYLGKDYKGVFLGNPVDPMDPLGRIAEPLEGWGSLKEPTKTTSWKTRILNGTCLNLVGTDSPNFDFPQNDPVRYPYLINWKKIEAVKDFWGSDSQQYYSQCVGVMKTGLLNRRIITRDMCREHHALEKAMWKGEKRTKIYAIDAAYSGTGGDRCVGGYVEFGEGEDGADIIRVGRPEVIPVSIRLPMKPEDQIAEFVKRKMETEGIRTENCFYDSTGRGTLGSAFARVFGNITPVPVEFGGRPTKRPVRHDLYIIDEKTKQRRHKRCDEHYFDFVSELWFSSRYVIESEQLRELPESVMLEGCQREYGTAAANKLFVESKHDPKARERMRRSPDEYDWLVTSIEGCRQRGFKIQKLGAIFIEGKDQFKWLKEQRDKHSKLVTSKALAYK